MKLTVLVENTTHLPHLQEEHGLSFHLQTQAHSILFDMGQTDIFAQNANKLGISLQSVDIAILSHGHYDHGGGLEKFLNINQHAKIYISKYAFNAYFSKERYIGLNESLKNNKRFILMDNFLEIDKKLSLHSCNELERTHDVPNTILKTQVEQAHILDNFKHEIYLLIKENSKNILVSGCSHKGILNIMHWFKPEVLIGGFHLKDYNLDDVHDKKYLDDIAKRLLSYNTMYYTCHCTGIAQFKHVETHMKNTIKYISTGEVLYV